MTQLYPSATRVDLDVQLGDTFTVVFPVLDVTDALVDVSAWSAHAQVRHTAGDALLYEWHTTPSAGQGTATVSTAGVGLVFDGTVTAVWTWRQPALFDLFVYDPTGVPHCVAAGRVRVLPSITTGA